MVDHAGTYAAGPDNCTSRPGTGTRGSAPRVGERAGPAAVEIADDGPWVRAEAVVALDRTERERFADRVESVRAAGVPEGAVDLRVVDADERHGRVRSAFETAAPGEEVVLASDRGPTPVWSFLATLAEGVDDPDELSVAIERSTPETWLLRTKRPAP